MKNTITQAQVDALIAEINVTTVYDKVTVVSVRLTNGFVLVESAGAVDKDCYSEDIGREICLARIKNKIWELEGYRLSAHLTSDIPKISEAISALCYEVEKIPASPQQTAVSVLTANLAQRMRNACGS